LSKIYSKGFAAAIPKILLFPLKIKRMTKTSVYPEN
jgi:hypothetical protein